MVRLGLVGGTSGNVSARVGELMRITPSALPYAGMEDADLVTLALDGTILEGKREPSSEWRVHAAVYAARLDARALVHTHSEQATTWSERGEPLGEWLTAPFAPSGSDEIARTAVAALGDRSAVLLGSHGVLALGGPPAPALAVWRAGGRAARGRPGQP